MDIVYAIGSFYITSTTLLVLTHISEDVPKGRNDRPVEDVTIYDSGEVCYFTFHCCVQHVHPPCLAAS